MSLAPHQAKQAQIDAAWDMHEHRIKPRQVYWAPLRHALAEAQNWRCCWCHRPMRDGRGAGTHLRIAGDVATIEHIIPRQLGGPDVIENVAVSCARCNHGRRVSRNELLDLAHQFRAGDIAGLLGELNALGAVLRSPELAQMIGASAAARAIETMHASERGDQSVGGRGGTRPR